MLNVKIQPIWLAIVKCKNSNYISYYKMWKLKRPDLLVNVKLILDREATTEESNIRCPSCKRQSYPQKWRPEKYPKKFIFWLVLKFDLDFFEKTFLITFDCHFVTSLEGGKLLGSSVLKVLIFWAFQNEWLQIIFSKKYKSKLCSIRKKNLI